MHEIHAICERRGVNCSASIKHEAPAAACHPTMIASLVNACRASEQVALHVLVSSSWIISTPRSKCEDVHKSICEED